MKHYFKCIFPIFNKIFWTSLCGLSSVDLKYKPKYQHWVPVYQRHTEKGKSRDIMLDWFFFPFILDSFLNSSLILTAYHTYRTFYAADQRAD